MDISTKGVWLRRIMTKGQGERVSTYTDDSNVALLVYFKNWRGCTNEFCFFFQSESDVGCKCSLSMVTVDCTIAYIAQCSIRGR